MIDGFVRLAAACPKLKVADPDYNSDQIIKLSLEAAKAGA